jgi:malonate transporter and related proteins
VRAGWLARNDMRALGQFVLRFALPALLFTMLARRSVAEIFDARFLLAYLGGSLIALAIGWFYARRGSASYRAFVGMGMSFSNSGYVGVPVLLPWLGPPAAVAIALTMIVENLLMLPLVLTLAERDGARRASAVAALRDTATTLLRHPLVLAIIAGIAVAALGIALPAPLQRAIDLMAQASAAVALFVIGGSLVGLQLQGQRRDLAAVAIGKLVIHPLAVAVLAWWLLADNPLLRTAAIALAAMPMLGIFPVLAQKHGHEGFCAAALLVTTVASFFTLSVLLWWLS